MLGSSSSLPPLVGMGGGQVCESVGNADLVSGHFQSQQSRESVDLLLTFHPSTSLITFIFGSSEVGRLWLDLVPCGGPDPLGMYSFFLRELIMFWLPISV